MSREPQGIVLIVDEMEEKVMFNDIVDCDGDVERVIRGAISFVKAANAVGDEDYYHEYSCYYCDWKDLRAFEKRR